MLHTIDYYNKFVVIKMVESLLAKDLMQAAKFVFYEFGLSIKLCSDAGTDFVSHQFENFCRCLNMDKAVTLLYHYQSNSEVEACIKFVKCTIKKCKQNNNYVYFALLQIRSALLRAEYPSPAMMLFNRPIRSLLPEIDREPLNINTDDKNYEALKSRQEAYIKNMILTKTVPYFLQDQQ